MPSSNNHRPRWIILECCWFAIKISIEEDLEGIQLVHSDVFEVCSNHFKSRDLQRSFYLLGVTFDCVRSLLAHWVLRTVPAMNMMTWFPVVPTDEIRFGASEYLCCMSAGDIKYRLSVDARIIAS